MPLWFLAAVSLAVAPPANLPPLVPLPAGVRVTASGVVTPPPGAVRVEVPAATADDVKARAEAVAAALRAMLATPDRAAVTLRLLDAGDPAAEGYTLDLDARGVTVAAPAPAGLFYGCQTLRQLLQLDTLPDDAPLRCPPVRIDDAPRFAWRGLHVDSGRHLQSLGELKKLVDLLALHKMNRLHWHLTEDQGWRIEIDRYPRLTSVGAWRDQSPRRDDRTRGDGTRYGGFYTKAQVRELVAYAAERFVTVVPEIEIPGHSAAALAAYPELGNVDVPGYDPGVVTRWGVFPYTLAPTAASLDFIDGVLTEVLELFPGQYVHVGGDEAPTTQWEQSPAARAFMRDNAIDDPRHVQSWFNAHLDTFLAARGRRMVGWDEVLEGPLSKRAIVMSWRGVEGGRAAAAAGHDVVMAPNSFAYLDYHQADPATEPVAIAGYLPLETVYGFDPTDGIAPADRGRVLGVQGQLWSEYLWSDAKLEYMAFPRACALAEVAWTPQARRGWDDFASRLPGHLGRLRALGVNYRQLEGGAAITPVE